MQIDSFKDTVKNIWQQDVNETDSAKRIVAKFKRLRKGLKIWAKELSQLTKLIQACNDLIMLYDTFEDFRSLSNVEWNGREIVKRHLLNLLEMQRAYWKQRATIRWVKFGEANSKYFQAKATIKYRVNHIASLHDDLGNTHREHNAKANILFNAFKKRLSTSVPTFNPLKLGSLLHRDVDLSMLEVPFS